MLKKVTDTFKEIAPAVDYWSLRLVDDRTENLTVRRNITEPILNTRSLGAHICVYKGTGIGYAATSDLTKSGLRIALQKAIDWAHITANIHLIDPKEIDKPKVCGSYETSVAEDWNSVGLADKQDWLHRINQKLAVSKAIVDWWATVEYRQTQVHFITPDATIFQSFSYIAPALEAVANKGLETQKRSYGVELSAQAGLEHLTRIEFEHSANRVADEALQLLHAPNCPTQCCELLLMPQQMILQIHESIGHPLELDRILGDERNYAGTSFVTCDMLGSYQYGSELLNVTFDPTQASQLATYRYDDEGTCAEREFLIKDGILQRPLGGASSQKRANCCGVASSRSCDWNRPSIDRMANINLEPGASRLQDMLTTVETGILMDTNRSWSIDDSRNKFQFGCEIAWIVENGERRNIIKNPNYRGISATFWRNLKAVGDESTFQIMGVSTCGKGEPNQAIQVGHASPACLFRDIQVFGGA